MLNAGGKSKRALSGGSESSAKRRKKAEDSSDSDSDSDEEAAQAKPSFAQKKEDSSDDSDSDSDSDKELPAKKAVAKKEESSSDDSDSSDSDDGAASQPAAKPVLESPKPAEKKKKGKRTPNVPFQRVKVEELHNGALTEHMKDNSFSIEVREFAFGFFFQSKDSIFFAFISPAWWRMGRKSKCGHDCDPRQGLPPRKNKEEARVIQGGQN